MANTIRIKKRASSSAAGAPSTLAPSELAFNENTGDLKLYYGYGDNGSGEASSIIVIGGSGGFFNKTDTRSANAILSGPTSGSAAAPTFRALVAADIPSIAHTKISDFDTGVRVNRLDQMASATNPISGVAPTADAHLCTKAYTDGVAQGLDVKDSCKVATTSSISLSGTQTIDGVSVSADERVLVRANSTASENGIYLCKAGSWARADDMASGSSAAGAFTFIEQGSTYADVGFVCSTNKGSDTVASDSLAFTQFSGQSTVTAGDGLDKSGNELSLDLKANSGVVISSTELALDLSASSITGTLAVSDGGTGATSASAARTALGLAINSDVVAYAADLNTLSSCQSGAASALAALTSTEVAILDGLTATTSELNVLDGITSSTAELNYVDGVTSNVQTQLDAKQASDADLTAIAALAKSDGNIIVGNGSTWVAESGATARTSLGAQTLAADLTSLSSCQSGGAAALAALTSSEIEVLDGATLSTTELNYVDGVTSAIQTQLDAKQASDADLTAIAGLSNSDGNFIVGNGSTWVAESGSTVRTSLGLAIGSNVQAYDADLDALSSCQSGGATALAALTSTEIGILDGATVTTAELNLIDGGTSATSTTLAAADRFLCNDAGTMKQVALSDLVTFLEDGSTSGFDVNGGTY